MMEPMNAVLWHLEASIDIINNTIKKRALAIIREMLYSKNAI